MRLTTRALLAAISMLALLLAASQWRLSRALAHLGKVALRADSAAASRDTTRMLELAALGDSLRTTLRAVQRRAVQQPQVSDAIDHALRRHGVEERTARAEIVAEVAALRARIAGDAPVTGNDGGVRRAGFTINEPPFRGTAAVTMARPSEPAALDLALAVDAARIDLRLGCGPTADGIRPATVNAIGPPWLSIALGDVQQDAGVCRSPALERRMPRWHLDIGPAYAVTIDQRTGEMTHGASVAAVLAIPWCDLLRRWLCP